MAGDSTYPGEPLQPTDVRRAADACREALAPHTAADWGRLGYRLEWSCRFALEHTVQALDNYAVQVATASMERFLPRHPQPPNLGLYHVFPNAYIVRLVEARAAVLAALAAGAPLELRAMHAMGVADAIGFAGMGCVEILVHTWDIARALDVPFEPPADLARRVVARMVPWTPPNAAPWPGLLWATGRADLPDRPRLGPGWVWQCGPAE